MNNPAEPAIATLRADAEAFFAAAVRAADPAGAVESALRARQAELAAARAITLVAFGKAACPMIRAALPFASGKLKAALALTNYENAIEIEGVTVMAAGHPIPDENGVQGAAAIEKAVAATEEGELVIVLTSGGGSALLCAPAEGVTLADKMALNQALIRSGADITEINTVRSMVSRLKGGRLARLAHRGRLVSLVLSDVPGDDLTIIASGPTVPSRATAEKALAILGKYGLLDSLPDAIRTHLRERAPKDDLAAPIPHAQSVIIGSNRLSLEAAETAARAAGYATLPGHAWLEGEVSAAAADLHAMARRAGEGRVAIVSGGEPVVMLTGTGKGGRNQELALRFAVANAAAPLGRPWAFLSGGTDGRDGPTEAAGAVVDAGTLSRMETAGMDVAARLADNDSNPALAASGDLLMTGGTGTNVADIQIILLG
jgi:hydroxypyruvate reductase